jgi:homoserine kinase type II
MDVLEIVQSWPIGKPLEISLINVGHMNNTHQVNTLSGQYILRIYSNSKDFERVKQEINIIEQLENCDISFSVPKFITDKYGEKIIKIATSEEDRFAILMSKIKGKHPEFANLEQAFSAGETLGELHNVLQKFNNKSESVSLSPYKDLFISHPLISNPYDILDLIPMSQTTQNILHNIVYESIHHVEALYTSLQQQFIHGDYSSGNILMLGNKVNGILDFEFSSIDLKCMDLAVGLNVFSAELWNTGYEWEIMNAFGLGYAKIQPLSSMEAESVPVLIRHRKVSIFIQFLGRYIEGRYNQSYMIDLINWLLDNEKWLEKNSSTLINLVKKWYR